MSVDEGVIKECTGLVLAGGLSRRMGSDKTQLAWPGLGGPSLLQAACQRLQGLFPQVLVSVRERRDDIDWPQVVDTVPDGGPLAGVCAGLAQADTPWVFALAADMPFVAPALICELAAWRSGYDAVMVISRGHLQPLAAYYSVTALPTLRAVLDGTGKRSLRAAIVRLNACIVHEEHLRSAEAGSSFFDLDTPADWDMARSLK